MAETITLMELPSHVRVFLLDEMATIECVFFFCAHKLRCLLHTNAKLKSRYRLSSGSSDKIQLGALVGAFKIGVEMAGTKEK